MSRQRGKFCSLYRERSSSSEPACALAESAGLGGSKFGQRPRRRAPVSAGEGGWSSSISMAMAQRAALITSALKQIRPEVPIVLVVAGRGAGGWGDRSRRNVVGEVAKSKPEWCLDALVSAASYEPKNDVEFFRLTGRSLVWHLRARR